MLLILSRNEVRWCVAFGGPALVYSLQAILSWCVAFGDLVHDLAG